MLALLSALILVNEDLKTIGALAGVLAIPGLGVLSLLYFAQAREVRRLRDWAGRAPERAGEIDQRVAAEAMARVSQAPLASRPPVPARPAAGGAGPASRVVGAPVGPPTVAAPPPGGA